MRCRSKIVHTSFSDHLWTGRHCQTMRFPLLVLWGSASSYFALAELSSARSPVTRTVRLPLNRAWLAIAIEHISIFKLAEHHLVDRLADC
jgi:hypothetical protein